MPLPCKWPHRLGGGGFGPVHSWPCTPPPRLLPEGGWRGWRWGALLGPCCAAPHAHCACRAHCVGPVCRGGNPCWPRCPHCGMIPPPSNGEEHHAGGQLSSSTHVSLFVSLFGSLVCVVYLCGLLWAPRTCGEGHCIVVPIQIVCLTNPLALSVVWVGAAFLWVGLAGTRQGVV